MTTMVPCKLEWSGNASRVVVTGTFDNWSKSIEMDRDGNLFTATVEIDTTLYNDFQYKFYVTGEHDDYWTVNDNVAKVNDGQMGNNNVFTAQEIELEKEKIAAATDVINNTEQDMVSLVDNINGDNKDAEDVETKKSKEAKDEAARIARRGNIAFQTEFTKKHLTKYNTPGELVDKADTATVWNAVKDSDVVFACDEDEVMKVSDVVPPAVSGWSPYITDAETCTFVQQRLPHGPNVPQRSILRAINTAEDSHPQQNLIFEGAIGGGRTTALAIGVVDTCRRKVQQVTKQFEEFVFAAEAKKAAAEAKKAEEIRIAEQGPRYEEYQPVAERVDNVEENQIVIPKPTLIKGVLILHILPNHEAALSATRIYQALLRDQEDLFVACAIGGSDSVELKTYILERQPEIIIGTAGRIRELIDDGTLELSMLLVTVIEGVEQYQTQTSDGESMHEQICEIMEHTVETGARTIATTAKIERKNIVEFGQRFTNTTKGLKHMKFGSNPIAFTKQSVRFVKINGPDELLPGDDARQTLLLARFWDAFRTVTTINGRWIVYVNSREDAVTVYKAFLSGKKFFRFSLGVAMLHSNMPQCERSQALDDFNNIEDFPSGVIVTTALASNVSFAGNPNLIMLEIPVTTGSYEDVPKLLQILASTGRFGNVAEVLAFVDELNEREMKVVAKWKDWVELTEGGLAGPPFDHVDFSLLRGGNTHNDDAGGDWGGAAAATFKEMPKVKKYRTDMDALERNAAENPDMMAYKPAVRPKKDMIAANNKWDVDVVAGSGGVGETW